MESNHATYSAIRWGQLSRSALLLSSFLFPLHAADLNGILRQGTPVRLRLLRTLSSAEAQQGDIVDFRTLDDVALDGTTVIPAGAKAIATVTVAEPRKSLARNGKLAMNMDYVQLPAGNKLPLRGVQYSKGAAHAVTSSGMMAGAIVSAPVLLFMHGKDAFLPEGHEITVYTNADYKVYSPASASPLARIKSIDPTLTEADILKLKIAGFSDEIIIQKITSAPAAYDVTVDELLRLKRAGLSDPVIKAMMTAVSGH
jgi:hypothetical protein